MQIGIVVRDLDAAMRTYVDVAEHVYTIEVAHNPEVAGSKFCPCYAFVVVIAGGGGRPSVSLLQSDGSPVSRLDKSCGQWCEPASPIS
jgi:hypothetical protein